MAALSSYDELVKRVGLTDSVLRQPCITDEEILASVSQSIQLPSTTLGQLLNVPVRDDTTTKNSVVLEWINLNGSEATYESLLKALVQYGDDSGFEAAATELKKASHPYGSFAPVQTKCTAKWFVNGEDYMAAVLDAIQNAQYEIMITDWMLSAQIFLERTEDGVPHLQHSSRLDKILLKKADEGVKIFLLIYHGEVKIHIPFKFTYLIDLGNEYSKKLLEHENIVFLLDPVVDLRLLKEDIIWSHHEKLVVVDQTLAFVGGIDLCYGRWDNHQHRLIDDYAKPPEEIQHKVSKKYQTWIGLDFMNDFVTAYEHDNFKTPFNDYIDRSKFPRLPWHDIACCVSGDTAKDVAQHFKQRYDYSKSYQDEAEYKGLEPHKSVDNPKLFIKEPATSNCTCQVLRSVSKWSAGTETEHSIQNAYIHAIENAEHFVYIENQFFISSLNFDSLKVTNGIARAIKERIARAYREKKKFRVILVIPLKPEITGDFLGSDWTGLNMKEKLLHGSGNFLIQDIMNVQYLTLSRDKYSIIQRLIKEDGMSEDDISNYLSIYGLRTCDFHDGVPVTEIVYVHAKCMIVDDRITIIGSANINERSMTGDRDSEVVIRFEDNTFIDGCMNGQPYKAGEFAHSLRLQLFREHMGLEEGSNLIIDPLSNEFYEAWNLSAKMNNEIFKEVFGGRIVPVNGIKTYHELHHYRKTKKGLIDESDIEKARKRLQDLKGNLIPFPMDFLINTDMSIGGEWRKNSVIFKPINAIVTMVAPSYAPDDPMNTNYH